MTKKKNSIQIKICGLTDPETACECANMGADSIGLVFFAKSPRNVSDTLAKKITDQLPEKTVKTGVFVNESYETIMSKVYKCGINAVQLHGNEPPALIEKLKENNIRVIKALFMKRTPFITDYNQYRPDSYLIECGKGILPGGNAEVWNWEDTHTFGAKNPLILAGGLTPENVSEAILKSEPHAVDISSGVELNPGIKDLDKVRRFIKNVKNTKLSKRCLKIF